MSSLRREVVFLILQFLDEEKFKDTVHRLEQESGIFFNMRYFEEMVTNGDLDEVEKYLSGFTKLDDNRYSMKIFFEIRKQKYLEALNKKNNHAKAVEILAKDLKVFSSNNEDLFNEVAQLLTLENFRDNLKLSTYGDTKSARGIMLTELKKLIEANPLFSGKLKFPVLESSRLRTLINQSLSLQHPELKARFDHSCGQSQPNGAHPPSFVTNVPNGLRNGPEVPPLATHTLLEPAQILLAGSMANPANVPPHASASPDPIAHFPPNSAVILKRPTTPNNPTVNYQTADSEHAVTKPFGKLDEVNIPPVNILPVEYVSQSHGQYSLSSIDFPRYPVMTLKQGSAVKSMDFHPVEGTLLLVGTSGGDAIVWDLVSWKRLSVKRFEIWNMEKASLPLQASLENNYITSVNRVKWTPDGTLFGVGYSKHLVHIYSYHDEGDVLNHLEIDAHTGSVNDFAFSNPEQRLSVVTCGTDQLVKVWDAVTGDKIYTFDGHEAPVYSLCLHHKENLQFIFSTDTDGKIKAWFYNNPSSRADYEAPGQSSTTMAYSSDGTRLFSCGTNKEGDSFLVEWNESEGHVKHKRYNGLGKRSEGVLQFDTAKNKILAVGDEFMIKLWDMDVVNLMETIDVDGLPASPCIRFNKEGILLAVSAKNNGIKILANAYGSSLLRKVGRFDTSRAGSSSVVKMELYADAKVATNYGLTFVPFLFIFIITISAYKLPPSISNVGISNVSAGTSMVDRDTPIAPLVAMNEDSEVMKKVKPSIFKESVGESQIWKLTEISEPTQCRSLKLSDQLPAATKVLRLIYTNSGVSILALTANGVHKFWKWPRKKATTHVLPQFWEPSPGLLMINNVGVTNPEDSVACVAVSRNNSYVISASGGNISLYNKLTFKTMTTFMPSPPKATFIAFYPRDNNIIAIGLEDSSILIYNVRLDEVKRRLKGHHKRITDLAFSKVLNVLISSGADSQLCVWGTNGWEKQTAKYLDNTTGRSSSCRTDTYVQFHHDQIQLLAVHETQIAIYEAPKLVCIKQWVSDEESGPITHAVYSCDGRSVYASFQSGSIAVFTAPSLQLRCHINPSSYLPTNPSLQVHPLVVAAHPSKPNQFALGLSDGGVYVLEPHKDERKWGPPPL